LCTAFLSNDLTVAYFNLSGKTPVPNIEFQIYVNGEIINGALNFNTILEIYLESLVFGDLIIFSIS
jgi:hypothetical protein